MKGRVRKRYYWDSVVFIAWIKDEKRKDHEMDGVKDCVQRLLRNEILLCTSTATSGEVLEGNLTAEQRDRYNLVFKGRKGATSAVGAEDRPYRKTHPGVLPRPEGERYQI